MSSPNTVNFGTNNGPNYTLNNNEHRYGENVNTSSYSPVGASGYNGGIESHRDTGYAYQGSPSHGVGSTHQSYGEGSYNLHVQPGTISGREYGHVRDINHPAPVTKVNFGSKIYTETYSPGTTSTYHAPPPPVYHQPVEIHSQPIR